MTHIKGEHPQMTAQHGIGIKRCFKLAAASSRRSGASEMATLLTAIKFQSK